MEARTDDVSRRYLDLMKHCLSRSIFDGYRRAELSSDDEVAFEARGLLAVERVPLDPEARATGRDWPIDAETMIGLARLENIEACVRSVISDRIPGDLIETGVWRGGATIFMRALLDALGDTERRVWVADSFQGLPRIEREHEDEGDGLWTHAALAVDVEQVRANFAKYGLLDDRVRFLKGWFEDTLPSAPIEELAVVRLDGDLYESTTVALEALYPKLSPGGYLIVDDYGALEQCRRAVDEYRSAHGITDPIIEIDWTGVYWRKEGTQMSLAPQAVNPPVSRYDMDVLADPNSTQARVVRRVRPGTRVLELGCAGGHMSKALQAQGCTVVGMEIDEAAAAAAVEFCERVIVGDMEQLDLAAELGDDRFDVIVAADVLEHLKNPERVLTSLKAFLAPGGYVVASMPNIGHASVRLALLQGRFEYTRTGLLDQTHLRFFTAESIQSFMRGCGFLIGALVRQQTAATESEVRFDVAAVPPDLLQQLATDQDALTYQFIVVAHPISADLEFVQDMVSELQRQKEALELELKLAEQRFDYQRAALERELAEKAEEVTLRERQAARALAGQAEQDEEIQRLHAAYAGVREQLHMVETARAWRMINKYWAFRNRLRQRLG